MYFYDTPCATPRHRFVVSSKMLLSAMCSAVCKIAAWASTVLRTAPEHVPAQLNAHSPASKFCACSGNADTSSYTLPGKGARAKSHLGFQGRRVHSRARRSSVRRNECVQVKRTMRICIRSEKGKIFPCCSQLCFKLQVIFLLETAATGQPASVSLVHRRRA